MVNFMYLTSAHLILYKDEKSAEASRNNSLVVHSSARFTSNNGSVHFLFQKHGNHYAAPRGVCDLKGASVSWLVMDKEKRKRKIIQLELCNGCRYLFRSANDMETQEWFDALRDVIARLNLHLPYMDHSTPPPIPARRTLGQFQRSYSAPLERRSQACSSSSLDCDRIY
ncbi:hypothetical protein COOONC_00790 [Cooperia oncophora]